MKVCLFYQSIVSDWNNGNAHFLRGIVRVLLEKNHDVTVYEPDDSWSVRCLIQSKGINEMNKFASVEPELYATRKEYNLASSNLALELEAADLVIVHEWNSLDLVKLIGEHRRSQANFCLLFHDTHHRMATEPFTMRLYDLRYYDGVLAYGKSIADLYKRNGQVNVRVWHEAADIALFRPRNSSNKKHQLVWIGNWGDGERAQELRDFLMSPVKELELNCTVYGVRYSKEALEELEESGIRYEGWLANYDVPNVFAQAEVTVHVPRSPYVTNLMGIPTIRVFEALACGIPLISAPWIDQEQLFSENVHYLVANNKDEMKEHIRFLLNDERSGIEMAQRGLEHIQNKHTCAHRVNELFQFYEEIT